MKNIFKKTALSFFVGVSGVGVASADVIQNLEINPYGHINLGYMHGNTGLGSESYIVDNANSASRIGARLRGELANHNLAAGAHLELGYVHNASNAVSPENKNIRGEFRDRHLNVFLEGSAGRFSLGQGDGAANTNIHADLSGTSVISFTNLSMVGGGLPFINKRTGEEVALGRVVNSLDFEGRYSRLRYDAPSLGPIDLSVSHGIKNSSDVTEFGARLSLPLAGRLTSRLGYSVHDIGGTTGDVETLGGSVSWIHTSGFNLTGAYSKRTDDDRASPDSNFYFAKVGYMLNETHAFDIHYGETRDLRLRGERAETIGLGYAYTPTRWLDIYAGYRNHSLSGTGAEYDSINVAMLGSRIKF